MADSVIAVAALAAFVFFVAGLFVGARLTRQDIRPSRMPHQTKTEQFSFVVQLMRELLATLRHDDVARERNEEPGECTCRDDRRRLSRKRFGRS